MTTVRTARRPRRRVAGLALVAACSVLLAGCSGGDGPPDPSAVDNPTVEATTSDTDLAEEKTESEEPAENLDEAFGTTLTVEVRDSGVRPNAAQVEVERGTELEIRVDASRPTELHVHSSPEQYLEFPEGRTSQTVTFDKTGVVEIEEHETDQVIAQVTVR